MHMTPTEYPSHLWSRWTKRTRPPRFARSVRLRRKNLALWVQQVAGAVERDGTQRIVLGPHVDEFLRASFVVGGLAMHVGSAAQRDDLLHLVGGRLVQIGRASCRERV